MVASLAVEVADRAVLPRLARLAAACRDAGVPVVHCGIAIDADRPPTVASRLQAAMARHAPLRVGTATAAVDPALALDPLDQVLVRHDGLSGYTVELDQILLTGRHNIVILAGVSTDLALLLIATAAIERGMEVVLAEDCTAGSTPDRHAAAITGPLAAMTTIASSLAIAEQLSPIACKRPDRY